MPCAVNDGVRIRYDVVGSGPPLVLHPAFVGSADDWVDDGYVAALQDHHQLILLDPRGQGQSGKPHLPAAYTAAQLVHDLLAVLDAAGIDRAHFWGYSRSGWTGFALGAAAPNRLRSLVLGGATPFEGNPQPTEGDFWLDGLGAGMAALLRDWETASPTSAFPPGMRARWLQADAGALMAAQRQHLMEPDLTEDVVAAIRVPALLYVGTRDEPELTERAARLMPNATFLALDGLDHLQAYTHRDRIVPAVLAFLAQVEAAPAP